MIRAEKIEELKELLETGSDVYIYGVSGSGKTYLVKQALQNLSNQCSIYINWTHDNTIKLIRKKYHQSVGIVVLDKVDKLLENDITALHTLDSLREEGQANPFVLISEFLIEDLYANHSTIDSKFSPIRYKVEIFN